MAIDHYLVTESGRITYDIYNRTMFSSPWIRLPRKAAWPQGMGEVVSNITWERPWIQGTENEWSEVNLSGAGFGNGTTNSCIPTADLVVFKQTLREMRLRQKAVHSPRFCVNDLLYTAKRQKQMESVLSNLSEQVRHYWIKFNREQFTWWGNKVIIEPGLSTNGEGSMVFPTTPATSILTQGVLDYFYNLLILEQAGKHQLSMQNGRPVFGLITDQLTARSLIRADDNIREDFRYSSQSDLLLKPLGITHTYNGFVYMIDDMPPRYNFDADLVEGSDPSSDLSSTDPWVPVPPYIQDADDRPIVNPAWLTAEYQDSFIYCKDAYRLLVPDSVTGVSKAQFKTQNYMGDFKWLNVINDDESSDSYNPDGTLGRFRGTLMAGVEGIAPQVMFALRHKVCQPQLGLLDCPA